MEKYRKFADAATGINPFALVRSPTTLSLVIAAALFPLRLAGALLLLLPLLFVLDVLVYAFFLVPGMSCVSRLLLAPCQRGLLRGLLFAGGNLGLTRESPKTVAMANAAGRDAAPAAGDVVVVNMQSPWDMCVLEVAGLLPRCIVAFYVGGAATTTTAGASAKKTDDDGSSSDGLLVVGPSPLQRWHVWWHIYGTGTVEFLRAAAACGGSGAGNSGHNGSVVHLTRLQQRCERLGVPLIFFPEGSCTNGKGMLITAPLRTRTAPRRVFVAAIDYDTTAVHTVLRPRRLLSFLFSMSASLHGSHDPAWYSPPFPVATLRMAVLTASPPTATGEGDTAVVWESAKVRQALCAASRSRRALAVGLREKCGYAEACEGRRAGNVFK
ncbi:acyltransferase [Trypanosoma rangeli]|uniref:Acyltransferase n=1 Tax=Trypanosoma rangeli TaxID=5698 RepID=A0A3S5IRZ0_TRYRA|nr:acyltransferase [Trypanosoma rangeli]RNF09359.1 acyltransferase [Trypanosoma rangeli]|eukprot:RNF09359.1 acyltransferase [Trypanosoma rangeli]